MQGAKAAKAAAKVSGDTKLAEDDLDEDGAKATADAKDVPSRGGAAAKGSKEVWSKEADYY